MSTHAFFSPLALLLVLFSACEISSGRRTTSGSVKTVVFTHSEKATVANEYLLPSIEEASEPNNRVVTKITSFSGETIVTPSLSADGTKLAFASNADKGWNIRMITIGQTGVQEVTRGNWVDSWPRFTGDASQILFCSNRIGDGYGICRISTTGVGGIGSVIQSGASLGFPDIRADGKLIFGAARTGAAPQLWTTESNGGFLTQLGEGSQPRWSPSGKEIAFVRRDRTTGLNHLWIVQADGSNERKLTDGDGNDVEPCWSADGKMLAFSSNRGQQNEWGFDIYTIDSEGNNLTQITSNTSYDGTPMFGPDPTQLYFLSSRANALNIWRVALK